MTNPVRGRLRRLLPSGQALLLIMLLNAGMMVLGGLALRDSYHQAHDRATRSAQDLALTLSEGLTGLFDRVDFALLGISDVAGQLPPDRVHALLTSWGRRVPEIEDFWIVDGDGQIRYSGRPFPEGGNTDVSDRDYFRQLRDGDSRGMVVTKPVLGRVTRRWVMILARRIDTVGGGFGGVVMATLPVDNVAAMFSALHLGKDGAVAMRAANDLSVMARYPENVGDSPAVGKTAVSRELRQAVHDNPQAGNYFAKAGIDGIERSLSYHRISRRDVYVVVGLATSDTITAWWRGAVPLMAGLLVFLALTLVGGSALSRIWRQRVDAHDRLRHMLMDRERFSEILSHHLQEPVRIQHIFAQRLKEQLPETLPPEALSSLDHVLRGAARLRALLRDVRIYLTLDELLDGGGRRCDSQSLLAQILLRREPKIQEAGARLQLGVLPPAPMNDRTFTLMMSALIDNCLEYRSPDRPLMIQVKGGDDIGGWVWFSVADNGIGVPRAYRDRVFNVFERLNPTPSQDGTGIGLAMVRKIVLRLGGQVEMTDGLAEDEAGEQRHGVRVTLRLPDASAS